MAVFKITTLKTFSYRGAAEEYSNTYYLDGTLPADDAAWTALALVLKNSEKLCLPSTVTWTHWYGYSDPDANADKSGVWTSSNTGTLSTTGGVIGPGDSAVWVRWDTGELSSSGKKVYLRKYFHPAVFTTGAPDTILSAQATALLAHGSTMTDGTSLAGSRIICRPNGHHGGTAAASTYVTTRTLKRRGKRPTS